MNTMKFKALLEALDCLPSEIKNNIIDMESTHGCFAGLISIVANDIPELKEIYESSHEYNGDYSYHEWANALGEYLECDWYASTEAHIETAFGKSRLDKMKNDDVIVYLHGIYERWIKFENKSNEFQYPNKGEME